MGPLLGSANFSGRGVHRQKRFTRTSNRACRRRCASAAGAFTLVEAMIAVSIVALLLTFLLPALKSARGQMKSLMCASNQKTAVFKFQLFAEGLSEDGRGRSERLGRKTFWMDDFQSSLYGTDTFWTARGPDAVTLQAGAELMMCPAGPATLTKVRGKEFGSGALTPPENVSIGMNSRLYRAVTVNEAGARVLAQKESTAVTVSILNHPYVPLLFDVDGIEAGKRGVAPFYSAPPGRGLNDPYTDGSRWIPSRRHRGGTNVAFVGGHVQSSLKPARESWDWEYQATVLRRLPSDPRK